LFESKEAFMAFYSILFNNINERPQGDSLGPPDFFIDLNLDQVVDAITVGRQEYNLKPFFYTLLSSWDAIKYRHEVFRDLENKDLFEMIRAFAKSFRMMRDHLAMVNKLYYKLQKEAWFVDTVEIYCDALIRMAKDLSGVDISSRGFLAFQEYLSDYLNSSSFNVSFVQSEGKVF
jgi:DNA mismatch repair protein MutS